MSSLRKFELSSDQEGISQSCLIETALMDIRWKLSFLAEAIPDWLNNGSCPSENAAIGIGTVLMELAEHVNAVSRALEGQDDAN